MLSDRSFPDHRTWHQRQDALRCSPHEFGLVVGEPVRFRFFASTTRREDKVGTRLEYWSNDELNELTELDVTLPEAGRSVGMVVPVHLCSAISEVGTLELQAISKQDHSQWKIEFDVRAGE